MKVIDRKDYTSEMWNIKSELDLSFNTLFQNQEFRSYIVSKEGYCPNNLNIDTMFEDDGSISSCCCLKHYGYESSFNKGQAYSDFGDYYTEKINDDFQEKYQQLMYEYMKEKNPLLFANLNYSQLLLSGKTFNMRKKRLIP